MIDEKKREFLKGVATFVAGSIAGGIGSSVGGDIWKAISNSNEVGEVEKEALEVLFESNNLPGIYPGSGNPLGLIDNGFKKLSTFLEFSSSSFSSYIQKAHNLELEIVENNLHHDFNYNPHKSALFLGGPVANDYVKKILGYTDKRVIRDKDVVNLPIPDESNKRVRWVQLHGETDYGIYNGKKELAKRYDNGKLVERAIYKLYDKNEKFTFRPLLSYEGFLEREWMTIVKLNELNSTKVIIGGMHGHSIEAFSRNITINLENIRSLSSKFDQFQVIVPVDLSHVKNLSGRFHTIGQLEWREAKIQELCV
ncbi:hypothetical protein QSV34_12700 [Porticoccus sp. W117]|uniref:hypothetical protein n=1 Tax=Porticoccus sp. W117 TaxID=3054777 RepID=UPI00259AC0FD|nr:hypothetical protein [Porticoccus sp. W117]MDM3872206.1 hypothetical protein [Porticoccus sp. W117]